MEIDPNAVATGTGGLGVLGALWFWFRNARRDGHKADAVDQSWEGIVAALRDEVQRLNTEVVSALRQEVDRLREEVRTLTSKVSRCENDREEANRIIKGFEQRYGSRKQEAAHGEQFSRGATGSPKP